MKFHSLVWSPFYPALSPGTSKSICIEAFAELAKMQYFDNGKCGLLGGFWCEMQS